MKLDIISLAVASGLLGALQAFGMLMLWHLNRGYCGLRFWVATNLIGGVALPLLALRTMVDFANWTVFSANVAVVLAFALLHEGTVRILGVRQRAWIPWGLFAAFVVVFAYYLFVVPDMRVRIIVISATLAFYYNLTGWRFLCQSPPTMRFSARFAAGVLFLSGTLMIFRTLATWQSPGVDSFFTPHIIQLIPFIGGIFALCLWSFATFGMVNQLQAAALRKQHEEAWALREREAEYCRMVELQREEEKRHALVRDLHDGLGGMNANLSILANLGRSESDPQRLAEILSQIEELSTQNAQELRSIMNVIHSGDFYWADWLAAFHDFSQQSLQMRGIQLVWRLRSLPKSPVAGNPAAVLSLLRAAKEAVTNAARHSGATKVVICLRFSRNRLVLKITDNGQGVSLVTTLPQRGRGLTNQEHRIQKLGGTLHLRPIPNHAHNRIERNYQAGFEVRLQLPLPCSLVLS